MLQDYSKDMLTDEENVLNIDDKTTALSLLTTPFFIWTNYDSQEEDLGYVSTNYFTFLLKEKAGLPLTQYDQFMKDLYAQYPVVSEYAVLDKTGKYYPNAEEADAPAIDEYECLQYYLMFDNK